MTVAELPLPHHPRDPARTRRGAEAEAKPQGLAIICYSGELEKTWAAMILASTAGAMGMPTKVFVTFWGLQTFVKDGKRITGENWMQKMLSMMSRPGIAHRKLSQDELPGHGPVDDVQARQAVQRLDARRSCSRWPRRWASSSSPAR